MTNITVKFRRLKMIQRLKHMNKFRKETPKPF